jgi:pantetheine-phosphate adenylyltransferase
MKALLAGSFDPPTLGHCDIVRRAAQLVEKLYVGIAHNPEKKSFFDPTVRKELLQAIFQDDPRIEITIIEGATGAYAQKMKIHALIRALRSPLDLDHESALAQINARVFHLETLFLLASPPHTLIRGSFVREMISLRLPLKEYLPPQVLAALPRPR